MDWYFQVLKKYAVFSGRAQRAEFWNFALFNIIISIVLGVIDALIFGTGYGSVLGSLYGLAVLLPSLGVGIRRLHDTGRSGWWYLLIFIPLIGAIVLIVFWVQDSQPEENRFEPNPKGRVGPKAVPDVPQLFGLRRALKIREPDRVQRA